MPSTIGSVCVLQLSSLKRVSWGFVATCCQKSVETLTKFKFGKTNVISSDFTSSSAKIAIVIFKIHDIGLKEIRFCYTKSIFVAYFA